MSPKALNLIQPTSKLINKIYKIHSKTYFPACWINCWRLSQNSPPPFTVNINLLTKRARQPSLAPLASYWALTTVLFSIIRSRSLNMSTMNIYKCGRCMLRSGANPGFSNRGVAGCTPAWIRGCIYTTQGIQQARTK